ncbi:hypothetical protein [Frankia sp. Cas3]|uniref:hypothetical protein n=1 Tax=Frankia sp. Cas3 TaxID=3073926 RepID=UPI002AD37C3C|nr:hypothetical protein [Frankia sp. Cas3]
MADLHGALEAIVAMVLDARGIPLSASCILNRTELLTALEDLRGQLPAEIAQARRILAERDGILDDARRERHRIATDTDIVRRAEAEAEQMLTQARDAADAARSEFDTYVDGKLAAFEVVLSRTLASVTRGRARLAPPPPGPRDRDDRIAASLDDRIDW